jgi:hypothetical protein
MIFAGVAFLGAARVLFGDEGEGVTRPEPVHAATT